MPICQICARKITLTLDGMIRPHGYRQNDVVNNIGGRVGGCPGAGYPPYEVSRDRILDKIRLAEDELLKFQQDPPKDWRPRAINEWIEAVTKDIKWLNERYTQSN
jgi:hypothetical protein